jgi:hypothetical protein
MTLANYCFYSSSTICSHLFKSFFPPSFVSFTFKIQSNTVKPVYNGHPRDPKKAAVVQRWPVFGGFSIKIGIRISLAGLSLAVAYRWPLFRGGRKHRFDCIFFVWISVSIIPRNKSALFTEM